MSYGFRIKKSNGAVKIDSDSFGTLFAEALTVQPKVGTFTKSYPQQKGMLLKGLAEATGFVSYPGGIPMVTIDTNRLSVATTYYFFIV